MKSSQKSNTRRAAVDHQRLVQRDGAARIQSYQEYHSKHCATDADMRRTLRKNFPAGMKFQRAKYKVGNVVEGTMWPGIYLVVGHGFTGSHGQERGCQGCKITDRIHRKWQWIGPDRTLRKISSLNDLDETRPRAKDGC